MTDGLRTSGRVRLLSPDTIKTGGNMNWLALIPVVAQLISFAEKLFTGSGKGELKKSVVLGAAEAVVSGMTAVSTGGQKDTWTAIAPQVSTIIDGVVAVANATGWVDIADDNFDNMKNGG